MINFHWRIKGNKIYAYVHSADNFEPIASIDIDRPVRQMLRYSQLGQECESIMDRILGGSISEKQAITLLGEFVMETIQDTSVRTKVQCPQVEE